MDALAILSGFLVLVTLALPILASTSSRSDQTICLNNLRLIGRALQVWGSAHGDRVPWRVPVEEGGSMRSFKPSAAWVEFLWLTNELSGPQVLVCPSDTETTRVARDFSSNPDGGFSHFNYRNQSLSYFLGTDAYSEYPRMVIAGDRNIRPDSVGACSAGYNSVAQIHSSDPPGPYPIDSAWTEGLHQWKGNLLFNDGGVRMVSQNEFHRYWNRADGSGFSHLLLPK